MVKVEWGWKPFLRYTGAPEGEAVKKIGRLTAAAVEMAKRRRRVARPRRWWEGTVEREVRTVMREG